jgi:hypothetical protein
MKTTLHTYNFNTDNPQDREPVHQLCARLNATIGRGSKMRAIKSNQDFNPEPGEITLEPEHLFENQWNSNVGRVFDWYEEAIWANGRELKNIKRGHYLEITPQMAAIRENTLKCGYTGQQFPISEFPEGTPRFNTTQQALGSPYLKESELHLCRLLPVSREWRDRRNELTPAERDYLLPLYIQAQTKPGVGARAKQIEGVHEEFKKTVATATINRDGFLWLLNRGINTENCIFYSHTGRFGFGWRNEYRRAAYSALSDLLKEFPFPYDIKGAG